MMSAESVSLFLRLREDVRWADITQLNADVLSHPVTWLGSATAVSASAN
jgi:hypothetical protein